MTRKRYIKLLMADGFSRNEANIAAREVVESGCTYQDDYEQYMRDRLAPLAEGVADIAAAMARTVETVERFTRALGEAFRAFGEAYRAALDEKEGGRA